MAEPTDVQHLVKQLMAGASPEENRALLEALMSGQVTSILEKLKRDEAPTLRPVPTEVRGFRVRLDLHGAKPPVWRRLELPGDLTLPRLHAVIQAAMGWYDSHLHRFRTGNDHRSPYFVTHFDLDEGEDGTLEDDVRLDQLLADKGDQLWYEYDFGDGWDHKLLVEEVLDEPPSTARCTGGRMACPRTAAASAATRNWPPGSAAGTTTRSSPASSTTPPTPTTGCPSTGTPTTSTSRRSTPPSRSRSPNPWRSPGSWLNSLSSSNTAASASCGRSWAVRSPTGPRRSPTTRRPG